MDREFPAQPCNVLLAGVENGGTWDVLQACLPEGSTVSGIDSNPDCASALPDCLTGDVTDRAWLNEALRGRWFDLILDCTGSMTPNLWPWLTSGGRYIFEGYVRNDVQKLVQDVADDTPSWLPVEEILRVTVYPHVAVVEKRHPRVMPYIEIMTGNFADAVPEQDLLDKGVKRVLLE
jgi:hypothetical protein